MSRLCYLAGVTALLCGACAPDIPAPHFVDEVPAWRVLFSAEPVDSTWIARAALGSISVPQAVLWIQCRGNTSGTSAWVHFHEDLSLPASQQVSAVALRFDSDRWERSDWRVSRFAKQALHPPAPRALMAMASRADTMMISVQIDWGHDLTAMWVIAHAKDALRALAKECRWDW